METYQKEEILEDMRSIGVPISEEKLIRCSRRSILIGNGTIEYTEFVMATMNQ